jgi:hypothetical protein
MAGLNGNGRAVVEAVQGLRERLGEGDPQDTVVCGFYIRLALEDGRRELAVGRKDRPLEADEVLAIGRAAGVPVGSEPTPGRKWIAAGGLRPQGIPTLEFAWREA